MGHLLLTAASSTTYRYLPTHRYHSLSLPITTYRPSPTLPTFYHQQHYPLPPTTTITLPTLYHSSILTPHYPHPPLLPTLCGTQHLTAHARTHLTETAPGRAAPGLFSRQP